MSEIKGLLYKTELSTLLIFNRTIKCRVLDAVMPLLTYLGSGAVTISFCLLIIGLGSEGIRDTGIQALISLAVSHLMVQILKRCICRLRPKEVVPDINTFKVSLDYYSFPSGHTAAAFSIATALALNMHGAAAPAYAAASVVAITRLYLGVHYPSDVLAGMFLAVVSSYAVHFFAYL
ncbi:undecaprenyl pyrophosphate phosphatase [Ruminiclostridium hungatei]|uniref:Undecaprenyl pyrophosphate phosphatase n=1 Tax=Ruminiclostridium hungatei TaxID=48256 RepID=A0A1V4SEX2_RUMHU|nr:phosphatase PAP2 family protein [Ruminiclostridium hungatei]OPX42374.1 undecaprenyl pyrophosphate phosphatase [Ruminiclostridium hungatei]